MDKRNQQLKKAFYIYLFVMVCVSVLLSAAAVKICTDMRDKILLSHAYILEPDPDLAMPETGGTFIIPPGKFANEDAANNVPEFTDREKILCHVLEILTVALPLFIVCLGIWITGSLFYSRKLKKPFRLLEQGITQIGQGNLDFSLDYPGQDELGKLCGAFETMRQEIVKNNTELWNMVEERKKLNASVAHDLRTPITVISGYSEYLRRNLSKDNISQEHMAEILSYIENATKRLEAYADSVHHIHMLENLDLEYVDTDLSALAIEISSALKVIADEADRQISVINHLPAREVCLSSVAVFRILENLVRNACCYSKENVYVELGMDDNYFTITVTDDGDGFSEKILDRAFQPFYKEENDDGSSSHFGMGLTICKVLSQKHGGTILIENGTDIGAKVFVKLKINRHL